MRYDFRVAERNVPDARPAFPFAESISEQAGRQIPISQRQAKDGIRVDRQFKRRIMPVKWEPCGRPWITFGDRCWKHCRSGTLGLTMAVLLGACGGSPTLMPTTAPAVEGGVATSVASPAPATPGVSTRPCEEGKLQVGDLPAIDDAWREGLTSALSKATDWQADARLSSLRIACQLFEADFRWQATFYSHTAQAFYSSDTGERAPSGFEDEVPYLDLDSVSFSQLHEILNGQGFPDDVVINPSPGIEVRLNSVISPFGPPEAPVNVILYHVAIERLGEVNDLFIDARDGAVYRYAN